MSSDATTGVSTTRQTLGGRVLSNQDVRNLVDEGRLIVIQGRDVLRLDKWADRHPGGRRVIQHVVGREAGSEIRGFHSAETRATMARFCIGVLENRWQNMVPPLHRNAYHGPEASQPLAPVPVHEDGEKKRGRSTAIGTGSIFALTATERSLSTHSSRTVKYSHPGSVFSSSSSSGESSSSVAQMDARTQDELLAKFSALSDRIEAEGLYAASLASYGRDLARCAALLGLMLFFVRRERYVTGACFMGFFWHQIVATAHDAGHLAVTQHWTLDTVIGTIVMNFAGGLSCGWWKRNHNIHHLVPNSLSHDADVQLLPLIALSPRLFEGIYSTVNEGVMEYTDTAGFLVGKQTWLYYFLLSFGRFNLYFLAFGYVIRELFGKNASRLTPMHRKHRILEAVGIVTFWVWYGYFLLYLSVPGAGNKFAFVLISHVVTLPLHVQLSVSHFSMSTEEGSTSETWIERQLRTTMDIDASRWLDWFHGGLQFQVTHHLFPRVPRHNLRRASEIVKSFCREVGLEYEVYDFPQCNKRLLGRLEEVARLARLLNDSKNEIVRRGEYLHGHWE